MKSTRLFVIIGLLGLILMISAMAIDFRVACPEEVEAGAEFACEIYLVDPADSSTGTAFTVEGASVQSVTFDPRLQDSSQNGRYGFAAFNAPFTGDGVVSTVTLVAPEDGSFEVSIIARRPAEHSFSPQVSRITTTGAVVSPPSPSPPPPPAECAGGCADDEVCERGVCVVQQPEPDSAAIDSAVEDIRGILSGEGSKLQKISAIAAILREILD